MTNNQPTKRAARTEQFRRKNARRKSLRAEILRERGRAQYLEWRHLSRWIRFYPAKVQDEFFRNGRLFSHTESSVDRSPNGGKP